MMKFSKKNIFLTILIFVILFATTCVVLFYTDKPLVDKILLSPQNYDITNKETWQGGLSEESDVTIGSFAGVVTNSFKKDGFLIFEVILEYPKSHNVYLVIDTPKEFSTMNSMNISYIQWSYASKVSNSDRIEYLKKGTGNLLETEYLSQDDLMKLLEHQKYLSFDVIIKYSGDKLISQDCLTKKELGCDKLILMNRFQGLKMDGKDVYVVKTLMDPLY